MFQRITLLRVSLGIVMVLSIPAAVGQTGSPENASPTGSNSFRVTAETRTVDEIRSEVSLEVLLDRVGAGGFLSSVLVDPNDERILPYITWNRRLAKVIGLLDALPRQEAAAAVIEFSTKTRRIVAERILREIEEISRESLSFKQMAEAAKRRNPGDVNWFSANYCAVFLVGRYAPEELVAFEKDMEKAASAAVKESSKVVDEVRRKLWTRVVERQVYPKLLWANVYRLALKRNGLDVPDEAAYATVLRELTFRKWDAIAKLPETGTGLGFEGRSYSDADTLEILEVIRQWPLYSPDTDLAGQEMYLSRLRHAVQKRWPKDISEPDQK